MKKLKKLKAAISLKLHKSGMLPGNLKSKMEKEIKNEIGLMFSRNFPRQDKK